MNKLSALIIVHNEEKQLKDCLETISFADEIIVILDKCTDNSKKIAKKYTKNTFSGSWEIEGDRRNYGLKKCKNEWILEIDADERVPIMLKNEIFKIINTSKYDWHLIKVTNFLGSEVINYGWGAYFGKSAYSGLFRKNVKKWGKQRVHPKIVMNGKKGQDLKNKLNHFCNISSHPHKFYQKILRYDFRANFVVVTLNLLNLVSKKLFWYFVPVDP